MRKLILCSIFCLLCSVCQAAQVIRYVDTDAPGPAHDGTSWNDAYLTLNAWNTGEATNLVTATNYHTVYCRSSAGTQDTTLATIGTGWTTSAANYIEVIGADFPADGIFDGTKYVLHNNDSGTYALTVSEQYVRLINLQVLVTCAGATSRRGIQLNYAGYSSMDSCIVKGIITGAAGYVYGVHLYYSDAVRLYNTIIYGFSSNSGVFVSNSDDVKYYNCTIYNCLTGIDLHATSSGSIIKNCAIGNCTDDIQTGPGATITHCCTDDGDGTDAQTPSGGAWANEFTTPGSNFSLLVGGNCVGNGTDNPGVGLYSDDIIGTVRSTTWDIGAFEYAAAPPAGGGGQVIIIEME